jgi:predicted CoA-binding protein
LISDDILRDTLLRVRRIALVGYSANPDRPSHRVARFLAGRGYRVIPVNPGLAGQQALGMTVRASLAALGEPVEMIDVFRRPEEIAALAEATLALDPRPFVFWTQLGLRDDRAAERLRAAGIRVVQDRCPAIEIPRLGLPPLGAT